MASLSGRRLSVIPTSFDTETPPAPVSVTRRKLVSTSTAANTALHSTSQITMNSGEVTLSFWWRPTEQGITNQSNTLFAGNGGNYQIYTGSGSNTKRVNLHARMDGTAQASRTTGASLNTWCHVLVHLGQNHDSGTDVQVFINGTSEVSETLSGPSTEMSTAGTHYILGDDAGGLNSDDGCIGEIFDLCMFDGIVDIVDTNYSTGSWKDLSSTGLSSLKYRIDGQNSSDAGEDSSGNGHGFIVENNGVTVSDTGLPAGANT